MDQAVAKSTISLPLPPYKHDAAFSTPTIRPPHHEKKGEAHIQKKQIPAMYTVQNDLLLITIWKSESLVSLFEWSRVHHASIAAEPYVTGMTHNKNTNTKILSMHTQFMPSFLRVIGSVRQAGP